MSLDYFRNDNTWLDERQLFLNQGTFGSLICPNTGNILWRPKQIGFNFIDPINIFVWDNHKQEYMNTTIEEIPRTFTLTSRINNKIKEFDLWRATALIINHQILFPEPNNSLTKDTYAKATSTNNYFNRGRFTLYNWAPDIKQFDFAYGGPWRPNTN